MTMRGITGFPDIGLTRRKSAFSGRPGIGPTQRAVTSGTLAIGDHMSGSMAELTTASVTVVSDTMADVGKATPSIITPRLPMLAAQSFVIPMSKGLTG